MSNATFLFRKPMWSCILFGITFFQCGTPTAQQENNQISTIQEVSYQPRYAERFTIVSHAEGIQVNIMHPNADTLRFVLGRDGQSNQAVHNYIPLGIAKGVFTSATHITFLEAIGKLGVVAGFSNFDFIGNPSTRSYLERKGVAEVGEESQLNHEQLVALQPDVIITSGLYEPTSRSNSSFVPFLEWKEAHPLGRAEWLIVMGALTGTMLEAQRYFETIERNYLEAKQLIGRQTNSKPTVLMGFPYQGQWFAPGGNSFMSVLLKDAGAVYPWESLNVPGSAVIDFEEVYRVGQQASHWIVAGHVYDLATVRSTDARFNEFKALQLGNVYNSSKQRTMEGYNMYYETSVIHPDYVLKDLTQIFHPSVSVSDTLHYFERLQ